jgi:tetratricopeptide (TPR) repeat protein
MGAADDAFSSVAARLIQGGVDATVAMSASVLVATSTRFFERFYRELVAGTPAPIAQERARQALHDDPHRHLFRRRRDEEGQPVELRDWWLPHFYQQRPLALQATRSVRKRKPQPAGAMLARLNTEMPPEPRYGFSGRAYELLQVERQLLRNKLIVISGFGGVGKTALVREAADWLTRTGMYTGACFVSFEHGGDAATLLSALGTFLGVYDGLYTPNDPAAALIRLKPALHAHPTLVIADNLESILPGGEAPLETAAHGQLWGVLLDLAKLHAGVLLTTRDLAFGDGRLSPGDRVTHLALGGLSPDDAYALATRLLSDLGIERTRAPYAGLRDLLAELDHHPLSIQLVLPALDIIPLATIRTEFTSLLPRFTDDHETGRNRSLLASLDYSLRRLSEAQRTLLPRLALFEGGASEDDLLAITKIPELEWVKLRQALEQAALLTAEQVEGSTAPFLHFHPVLAPYLRGQQGAGDVALRERYTQRYYGLAGYLYREDHQHPQAVRALVQKELPNLRRALELLLEAGDLDTASDMADSIAKFLTFFGLLRELDELRRRLGEAVAEKRTHESGELTYAEYLRESGLGEDELQRGDIRAAYTRFTTLLARIEALPEGVPLGRGSYEHSVTLARLARCLQDSGQPAAAEGYLRKALTMIEALLNQQPENQQLIRMYGVLLTELADVLRDQGKYSQAREAYEEALGIAKQLDDLRSQGVKQGQLGFLALLQRDYAEAQSRYAAALQFFQRLGEPATEAAVWHQLGAVAQEQHAWTEAERCYRESLAIEEQLGNAAGAAMTCNQLAMVSKGAGRPVEAEGWYKRAIELKAQVEPGSSSHAISLNNLANLLVNEICAGRVAPTRLAEAQRYAGQALAIRETLDASAEIWNPLERRSSNGKDEIDRPSQRWLAQEKRT